MNDPVRRKIIFVIADDRFTIRTWTFDLSSGFQRLPDFHPPNTTAPEHRVLDECARPALAYHDAWQIPVLLHRGVLFALTDRLVAGRIVHTWVRLPGQLEWNAPACRPYKRPFGLTYSASLKALVLVNSWNTTQLARYDKSASAWMPVHVNAFVPSPPRPNKFSPFTHALSLDPWEMNGIQYYVSPHSELGHAQQWFFNHTTHTWHQTAASDQFHEYTSCFDGETLYMRSIAATYLGVQFSLFLKIDPALRSCPTFFYSLRHAPLRALSVLDAVAALGLAIGVAVLFRWHRRKAWHRPQLDCMTETQPQEPTPESESDDANKSAEDGAEAESSSSSSSSSSPSSSSSSSSSSPSPPSSPLPSPPWNHEAHGVLFSLRDCWKGYDPHSFRFAMFHHFLRYALWAALLMAVTHVLFYLSWVWISWGHFPWFWIACQPFQVLHAYLPFRIQEKIFSFMYPTVGILMYIYFAAQGRSLGAYLKPLARPKEGQQASLWWSIKDYCTLERPRNGLRILCCNTMILILSIPLNASIVYFITLHQALAGIPAIFRMLLKTIFNMLISKICYKLVSLFIFCVTFRGSALSEKMVSAFKGTTFIFGNYLTTLFMFFYGSPFLDPDRFLVLLRDFIFQLVMVPAILEAMLFVGEALHVFRLHRKARGKKPLPRVLRLVYLLERENGSFHAFEDYCGMLFPISGVALCTIFPVLYLPMIVMMALCLLSTYVRLRIFGRYHPHPSPLLPLFFSSAFHVCLLYNCAILLSLPVRLFWVFFKNHRPDIIWQDEMFVNLRVAFVSVAIIVVRCVIFYKFDLGHRYWKGCLNPVGFIGKEKKDTGESGLSDALLTTEMSLKAPMLVQRQMG